MSKKTLILIMIAVVVIFLVNQKGNEVIIPKEAIRIRIISNSNTDYDIKEKMKIKSEIEKEIYSLLKEVKTIEEARNIINQNLDKLNVIIEDEISSDYEVSFGNHYFPRKTYKGLIYEEGMYESLVVTLGSGEGDNWWCVLFPPLCLLEGNEETEDVEYQFLVKELLDRYVG